MHIVLFGGAFDPLHLGHIAVAKNFVNLGLADRLVFLPVNNHAFEKNMVSSSHRLKMLEIVRKKHFSNLPVYISDYEINREGLSITYETLVSLSKKNPHNQYSFLIGSDNLTSFDQWHHYQKMLEQFKFFVYPRVNFTFDNLKKGMIPLKNMPKMEVSSRLVKQKLTNGDNLSQLLSPEIIDYIKEHSLYK